VKSGGFIRGWCRSTKGCSSSISLMAKCELGSRLIPKVAHFLITFKLKMRKGSLSANSKVLRSIDAVLDIETSKFLEDRSDCGLLSADDVSIDDEDRQRFIAQALHDLGCDQLMGRQSEALRNVRKSGNSPFIRIPESVPMQ